MKLGRFSYKNNEQYGVLINKTKILSLSVISPYYRRLIPKRLEDMILQNHKTIKKVENMLSEIKKENEEAVYDLTEIKFLPPITHPPKIICLGLNYYDHAAEAKAEVPDEPVIFMKPSTTLTGSNQPIVKPKFVKQLDYEGELVIVIGKKGKNIPLEKAEDYIFGYTIMNDVSARDIQFKDKQWTRGKSFDTFAPLGPYITTANQIGNLNNLRIKTWVNGELRQDSSTKNMVFNVFQIVHHLSKVMTLEPCDIIATGTPAGVGTFMKPPKFLQVGDEVKIEIENIGILVNKVVE